MSEEHRRSTHLDMTRLKKSYRTQTDWAPEKKLTLFALRLAVLEKSATSLGTLASIWATVVLLGGFAVTLNKQDFWLVSIILVIEGTRIFSRSHELEWQHQTTWSLSDSGIKRSFPTLFGESPREIPRIPNREVSKSNPSEGSSRRWKTSDVPLLPYDERLFRARNISRIFFWLQILSAVTCVTLSSVMLIKNDYGQTKGDEEKRNRNSALIIFYTLALAEALCFLIEKAYWEWMVSIKKLLEDVHEECGLKDLHIISTVRFFYDAYSRCINGSIFDGVKMDMVTFAIELLSSDSSHEQSIGIGILLQLSTNIEFSNDTLQKIGVNLSVIERLVEMLNWKDAKEEYIRLSAAKILSNLAGEKQNSLRVAGIPGSMESISSLLGMSRISTNSGDEKGEKKSFCWDCSCLGLTILKQLANDHDNCGKMGNTRGLLSKIVELTRTGERLLTIGTDPEEVRQIQAAEEALQVLKILAGTKGTTGKHLRKDISEKVYSISNIRTILLYGDNYPNLQKLGVDILSDLALETDAKAIIGATGGVISVLFRIFFKEDLPEERDDVRKAAGKALALLALESECNCNWILEVPKVLEKLGSFLTHRFLNVSAARILRNLCAYSESSTYNKLKGITAVAATVLKEIVTGKNGVQEIMVGLGAQVFKIMSPEESSRIFKDTSITEAVLAVKLIEILKTNKYPPTKMPRIRRFTIELLIWMMKDSPENIGILKEKEIRTEMESVLETTSELECFNIISGAVGISRHRTTVQSLVQTALDLLTNGQTGSQ